MLVPLGATCTAMHGLAPTARAAYPIAEAGEAVAAEPAMIADASSTERLEAMSWPAVAPGRRASSLDVVQHSGLPSHRALSR